MVRLAIIGLVVTVVTVVTGCSNNCAIHTVGCTDAICEVLWDCGDDTRRVHVTEDNGLTCVENGVARDGGDGEGVCDIMSANANASVLIGDAAFDELDDAVNQACVWNIRSVEPVIIGGCEVQ